MKEVLYYLLFLIPLSDMAFAQPGWLWQNPLPTGNDLWSISLIDANVGTAVGDNGTILRTTNGGATWTLQSSGTTVNLKSVCFTDANTGTAVGYTFDVSFHGVILRTTNGGVTWTQQPADNRYHGVYFTDANTGSIVGDDGSILRTTNGGVNWTAQTTKTSRDLYAIAFVDANIGTAVGDSGTILQTTNGGTTWQVRSSGTTYALHAVSVADAKTVVAVGDRGTALRTTDGGNTWKLITNSNPTDGDLTGVKFWDAQTGVIEDGIIFRTTNGGNTWDEWIVKDTFPSSYRLAHVIGLSFGDAKSGIAVGTHGTVARTTNGGRTWATLSKSLVDNTSLEAVSCFGDTETVVGGGSVLRTTDGGASWALYDQGNSKSLSGLYMFDGRQGVAVGHNGLIMLSYTGTSWSVEQNGTGIGDLQSVAFVDANNGIAAGGAVIRTSDGGFSWSIPKPGPDCNCNAVARSGTNSFIVVGSGGCTSLSTDGGQTWTTPRHADSNYALTAVDFADANHGTAVGGAGTILHTTDGGWTWKRQQSETIQNLYGVSFADINNGIAVGGSGTILRTTNGGQTWIKQISGTTEPLNAVSFHDINTATVVGNNKVILHTTTGGFGDSPPLSSVGEMPRAMMDSRCYPNPFATSTTITYYVPYACLSFVEIYDRTGKEIKTISGGYGTAGHHAIAIDAAGLNDGLYFYRVIAGRQTMEGKFIISK